MGEVYKATDTRLGRTVAIKVLPERLSDNAELRQRFEQEARAVSSLNHPHICTLHDIGHENGIDFIVMEYIEGETLATRLERGAIPFGEAIEIGVQVADALDKAHRERVVHRDLKPSNMMLTKRGVKLLDFGVAKLLEGPEVSGATEQPTRQKPLTDAGALLGTVQYMAPEQLEGKDVDARTDIFAFGAVLYEMLTGRKAFEGGSQASVIGAILKDEPAPLELEPTPPRGLERIIRKCLVKDPEDRWYAAHDLMDALRWIDEEESEPSDSEQSTWRFSGVAGLVIGASLAAFVLALFPSPSLESDAVSRYEIALSADLMIAKFSRDRPIAFSPGGDQLIYAAEDSDGVRRLYRRERSRFESTIIPGTERAHTPFFSPDGQWIGFFASGKLWKLALTGGAPREICDAPEANVSNGAIWGPDDSILFTAGVDSGLYRVSADGGPRDVLLEGGSVASPQFLPGETSVLFSRRHQGAEPQLHVLDLNTEVTTSLEGLGSTEWARYLQTGHLVYYQGASLLAVKFDATKRAAVGTPVTVVTDENLFGATISRAGSLAYASGSSANSGSLVVVDRSGRQVRVYGEKGQEYWYPRYSPSRQEVVVLYGGDVRVVDLARGTSTRGLFQGVTGDSVWTTDGAALTFPNADAGTSDIYQSPLSGSGEATLLVEHENPLYPHSWAPDGKHLAYYEVNPETARDILDPVRRGRLREAVSRHAVQRALAGVLTRRRLYRLCLR